MIKLYNTLSKTKEVFKPIKGKTVGFYTCGPTVYDCAHIGNFRTYIFEDVLRRVLEFNGYKVNHIENITDVDDKTIKRSIQKKMSLHNLTEKFTNIFFSDLKKVNIKPAVKFPRATKHIKQMVELIQKLLDKNIAYLSDDRSIYFSIKKFKNYGKFANLDLMGLKEGARVLADEYQKEQGSDFVLWKKWNKNDGDNFWKQEFAISDPSTSLPRAYSGQVGTSKRYAIKGRPGWHLECSAMSKKYLGQPFDIHAGAVDLIFPHHQNEIAQSEAAYGKKMVNYWIHGEHLLVDKKKMAKSAGNFYALADIIKKDYHPLALRYLCLESHYRSKMNFTWKALDAAQNTLNAIRQLGQRQKTSKHLNIKTLKHITEAFNNDLDLPKALALLHQANDFNLWLEVDKILGLKLSVDSFQLSAKQNVLIEQREKARKDKDFDKADKIRKELEEQGIKIEDTNSGQKILTNL